MICFISSRKESPVFRALVAISRDGQSWSDIRNFSDGDCYAHISGELRFDHRMKTTITTLVLLGCAFFLGACASDEPVHTHSGHTTTTSTSTGYSK